MITRSIMFYATEIDRKTGVSGEKRLAIKIPVDSIAEKHRRTGANGFYMSVDDVTGDTGARLYYCEALSHGQMETEEAK